MVVSVQEWMDCGPNSKVTAACVHQDVELVRTERPRHVSFACICVWFSFVTLQIIKEPHPVLFPCSALFHIHAPHMPFTVEASQVPLPRSSISFSLHLFQTSVIDMHCTVHRQHIL